MTVVYVTRYKLQLRDAFTLIESLSVAKMLLLFINLGSSCRKPAILLHFYHNQATKELLQGWMDRNKHQTFPEMLIYRPSSR